MRIGVIRHFYEPHLPAEDEMRLAFEAALKELTKLGALLEDVKLRELEEYDDCKVIISEAEFFAVHEKDDRKTSRLRCQLAISRPPRWPNPRG